MPKKTTLPVPYAPLPSAVDMKRTRLEFLAWNAAQPDPMPVCPKCAMPFDKSQEADLFAGWCCSCEGNLAIRYVHRLMRRWGREGAIAKLRALGRERRQPSAAAIKRGAAKRIAAAKKTVVLDIELVLSPAK